MRRFILLPIALTLSAVVAFPALAQAGQWGFSDAPRRGVQRAPAIKQTQTIAIASKPTVVVDKSSGRYLQSVGKRVADRPLACPPKRTKRR